MNGTGEQPDLLKLHAKPPCSNKVPLVGISFDEKDFPAFNSITKTTSSKPQTTKANETTAQPAIIAQPQPPKFNYKAELKRLSEEIENNLKKQFEALFQAMDQKIDKLMQQHEQSCLEQKNNTKNRNKLTPQS